MTWFTESDCDLETFAGICGRQLDPATVPHAAAVETKVPLYDMPALSGVLEDSARRRALQAEWVSVLRDGAGVLVLKGAMTDRAAIDAATQVYDRIIAAETAGARAGGDHFAAAGANDRVWNALQKLCLAAPEVFARYFACPAIDAVSEA